MSEQLKNAFSLTVCDEPMLEEGRAVPENSAGTPGPDGFTPVETPDGQVTINFPTPSELTQVKVRPSSSEINPGDSVTVTVVYTKEEGEPETKVRAWPRDKCLYGFHTLNSLERSN